MKSGLSFAILTTLWLTLLAPQSMAQNRQLSQATTPRISNDLELKKELPVMETPLIIGYPQELQTMEMVQMAPPPGVAWAWCEATEARINRIAYQFICKMTYPDGHSKSSLWVIRRDGSAPSWALTPEDFSDVMEIISDKRYGFEFPAVQPRSSKTYFRTFYTKENTKAPNKYCSANILDYRAADDVPDRDILGGLSGHNSMECYDLMTLSFKPQKEN